MSESSRMSSFVSRIPVRHKSNSKSKKKNAAVQSNVNNTSNISDTVQTSFPNLIEDPEEIDYEEIERIGKNSVTDPIHSEFLYYCAMLKEIVPLMTKERHRKKIILWIKKLLRPEYHSSMLQDKRNRFLMMICLSVLNNETFAILKNHPPKGALPHFSYLQNFGYKLGEWEDDNTWSNFTDNSKELTNNGCSVHRIQKCISESSLDQILDDEFKYLLYLLQPYVKSVDQKSDRQKLRSWLEALCEIRSTSKCTTMKGIRNDYIMALYGYIQGLQLAGPFMKYPDMSKPLLPLHESAKLSYQPHIYIDVTSKDVSEFMSTQPMPDDGAFCYIGVTGTPIFQEINPITPMYSKV